MRFKAPDLVDELLEKMYLTTSIAMDWPHNLQRQLQHPRQHQHQRRQFHLHLLRHRHQPQLLHQRRHLPLRLVQLQLLEIASKSLRCRRFAGLLARTW